MRMDVGAQALLPKIRSAPQLAGWRQPCSSAGHDIIDRHPPLITSCLVLVSVRGRVRDA